MCCENRAWKNARLMQNKKTGNCTCLHFLLCLLSDQLYICSCAGYTGLLFRWYESTAAIARVSEEYLMSHCTMERRQDGLPANRVRNCGQRERNPPWYCNCPYFVEDRWTAYVMWGYVYWDRASGESLIEWKLFLYCSCWVLFGLLRGQQLNPSRRVPENVLLCHWPPTRIRISESNLPVISWHFHRVQTVMQGCGWPCWHERTELWGMLSVWRGLFVRCSKQHTLKTCTSFDKRSAR